MLLATAYFPFVSCDCFLTLDSRNRYNASDPNELLSREDGNGCYRSSYNLIFWGHILHNPLTSSCRVKHTVLSAETIWCRWGGALSGGPAGGGGRAPGGGPGGL